MVSISLLLYKPGVYLKPCLESIFRQSFRDFELLVIDNDSSDGTAQKAEEILKSQGTEINWRLIVNEKNSGFAAGQNQGIWESKGEFILLLNQDAVLDEDFLKNIIEVFEKDRKIGAVQGKLLRLKVGEEKFEKTDLIDNAGLKIFKNRRIIARGQGEKDTGQFDRMEEIFGADGAAPIYRRTALEETKICVDSRIGSASVPRSEYFDEDFFMYKEDVDLAWRLRLFGWKAFLEPKALAWHSRTAGESAAKNYLGIWQERRKINKKAKFFSFRNQRWMQIKNEISSLFLKHIFWWLPKEILSWVYILFFESYTLSSIKDLFVQLPKFRQKRKMIMARKKINAKEMEKWFN